MITLNGKKFAESDRETIDSLFDPTGSCVGRAKRYRREIRLYDMRGNIVGFIAHIVGTSTVQTDGTIWHTYGTPAILGEYPLPKQYADIEACAIGRDTKGRFFKLSSGSQGIKKKKTGEPK